MHLVGLFFTKRTYGIRVKLTIEEQSIFEVDERSNTYQAAVDVEETKTWNMTKIDSEILQDELGHEYEGYFDFHSHSQKVETITHPLYPGIHFYPQGQDFHPTESRAHVSFYTM
jgi:hypothetical protein